MSFSLLLNLILPSVLMWIFERIAECKTIKLPQKTLLSYGKHSLKPAVWQKRTTAFSSKTVKETLIIKRSDNIADPNILGISCEPNATVSTADAFYVAGCDERLQYFRHMVSGDCEVVCDRRSGENFWTAFSEKKQCSKSKVDKIGYAHSRRDCAT